MKMKFLGEEIEIIDVRNDELDIWIALSQIDGLLNHGNKRTIAFHPSSLIKIIEVLIDFDFRIYCERSLYDAFPIPKKLNNIGIGIGYSNYYNMMYLKNMGQITTSSNLPEVVF